jgi:hypothetical protein
MNWYNYVGGDPVNATDPSGLTTMAECLAERAAATDSVVVCRGSKGGEVNFGDYGSNQGILAFVDGQARDRARFVAEHRDMSTRRTPQRVDAARSRGVCRLNAAASGALAFGLDSLSLIPGEKAALETVKLGATAAQLGYAYFTKDNAGFALTAGGHANNLAREGVQIYSADIGKRLGSTLLRVLPVTGQLLTAASLAKDVLDAKDAYNKCN